MWESVVHTLYENYHTAERQASQVTERRKDKRFRIILPVICQSYDQNDQFVIMTQNMNIFGIGFISSAGLRVGELLDMSIVLQSKRMNTSAQGQVIWCEKRSQNGSSYYEGGILFVALEPDSRQYLEKFILDYQNDEQ